MDEHLAHVSGDEPDSSTALLNDPHPGTRLVNPDEWPAIATELGLTVREWEVVVLLFQSETVEATARKLSIKSRTVRQYVEQVHTKLNLSDRVELVLRVIEVRDDLREAKQNELH